MRAAAADNNRIKKYTLGNLNKLTRLTLIHQSVRHGRKIITKVLLKMKELYLINKVITIIIACVCREGGGGGGGLCANLCARNLRLDEQCGNWDRSRSIFKS